MKQSWNREGQRESDEVLMPGFHGGRKETNMAEKTPQNLNQLTHGKPIAGFHQTRTAFWVGVSAVLHIILILSLSGRYVLDEWVDPENAEARRAKDAEVMAANTAESGKGAGATTKPAAATPASNNAKPAEGKGKPPVDDELAKHADTPIVKKTTEVAKPGEIPTKPDDGLGISIDETNKK